MMIGKAELLCLARQTAEWRIVKRYADVINTLARAVLMVRLFEQLSEFVDIAFAPNDEEDVQV